MSMSDGERYARSRVLKTFLLPWIPVIVLALIYIFTVGNEALATLSLIVGIVTLLAFIAAVIYFMRSIKSFRDEG
jgi:heme/copper-type cytochrome/quinol oxidase subunit 4